MSEARALTPKATGPPTDSAVSAVSKGAPPW